MNSGLILRLGMEVDDGRTPAPERLARQMEFPDIGAARQESVDGCAQRADAFTMDDADAKDMPLAAGIQIIVYDRLRIPRPKGVKVEDTVDWELEWVIRGAGRI